MARSALLHPEPEAVAPPPAAAGTCNAQEQEQEHLACRFLRLPRELRDKIYDHTFGLEDARSERALRIERRNLKLFRPSAAAVLLILHHEYFLLSRQIAEEALEVLLKRHTLFLSCGPFVLKSLLAQIQHHGGPGRKWLRWMNAFHLDWVTFPNLAMYPPNRQDGRDEWYWEEDEDEEGQFADVMHDVRGAEYTGHYDEYDHDGGHYDDNFFDPANTSLYPDFYPPTALQASTPDDPFGFRHLHAIPEPSESLSDVSAENSEDEIATNLDLLVSMEVAPLFAYLASPIFCLTSITLPLYFISKEYLYVRSTARPGYALPLKVRFWVHMCAHALLLLKEPRSAANTPLQQVRVKYRPWDIWASMTPADDLHRMVEKGIWFDESTDEDGDGDGHAVAREGEGEAFRAMWAELAAKQDEDSAEKHFGLAADVRFVPWDGNVDYWRVGDELEVVFTKSTGKKGKK